MTDPFEDHVWKDLVDADTLEVYAAYRRGLFIGARPALLAIDLYNLAFAGGPKPPSELVRDHPSSCGVEAWTAVEPIKQLMEACRNRGLPLIYTTAETRPEARPEAAAATRRQHGLGDLQDFDFFPDLRPAPQDQVVYKQRASAFFGTPLAAHLIARGIDSLIVCGESTSGCVRASVVDAYSHGFHVVVVEECVFDRSRLPHAISLFDMHHKYADVMHLADVLAHLGG